jgi:hypothetical protein
MPRMIESAAELQRRMKTNSTSRSGSGSMPCLWPPAAKRTTATRLPRAGRASAQRRRLVSRLCPGWFRPCPALSAAHTPSPPAYHRDRLDGPTRNTPGPARLCRLSSDSALVSRGASGLLGLFECP